MPIHHEIPALDQNIAGFTILDPSDISPDYAPYGINSVAAWDSIGSGSRTSIASGSAHYGPYKLIRSTSQFASLTEIANIQDEGILIAALLNATHSSSVMNARITIDGNVVFNLGDATGISGSRLIWGSLGDATLLPHVLGLAIKFYGQLKVEFKSTISGRFLGIYMLSN